MTIFFIVLINNLFLFFHVVCRDPSSRLSRLRALNNEAERDMYRLKGEFTSQSATNSSGVKDAERRYRRGERRIQLYRRMLQNYENAGMYCGREGGRREGGREREERGGEDRGLVRVGRGKAEDW